MKGIFNGHPVNLLVRNIIFIFRFISAWIISIAFEANSDAMFPRLDGVRAVLVNGASVSMFETAPVLFHSSNDGNKSVICWQASG